MFVEFSPYGRGEPVQINVSRVTYVEAYSSNCDSGSLLHLDDGSKVLVGEYPSQVTDKLNATK